jgi:hypothetical protein
MDAALALRRGASHLTGEQGGHHGRQAPVDHTAQHGHQSHQDSRLGGRPRPCGDAFQPGLNRTRQRQGVAGHQHQAHLKSEREEIAAKQAGAPTDHGHLEARAPVVGLSGPALEQTDPQGEGHQGQQQSQNEGAGNVPFSETIENRS